ncbi:pentapeptide repeat-containing protein [bacterium endosymbiont of Bathymodiolus sp. 5 South]|uniref:pentapeptide repeat-containing protein n=1 Tax=bacterium endosymbiont of Bathymodiolus sp. 5 South TaxID=1181670 RepID=UPI0015D5AF01|nr:pentapeptide repeat-containing protein [bacterium endosymbiont of Bathymodiolus sp. 5 South]
MFFIHKRLKNQERQIDLQINQRVDGRFNSAIGLLGSSETSARTGAVYALHELALEEEKYRQQIAQILCSHIRSKTNEQEYKKNHEKRPSNEIQTTLNLLFKKKEHGLYAQDFAKVAGFPRADLSHAYLVEASFSDTQCQGASFRGAQCQGADFWNTQCQGASFLNTQCQGAYFWNTQCQGASFRDAQCQGVNFWGAQCQGADFLGAQCQGANFRDAQCQGANFRNAQCQGAYALKTFSFRIDKNTEFETLQLEGEIAENVIKNIENAKKYLSELWYEDLQTIIKDNKSKEPKYGTPKDCTTGILEDSKELQAIIKKDWKKLEQLNKKQHD